MIMQPDPQLAAVIREIKGFDGKCENCRQTPARLEIFSLEPTRGELFIARVPEPGVMLDKAHLLCNSCWLKMLMQNARRGFDIHTHGSTESCDTNCLTRRNGRKAQFISLSTMVTQRDTGFFLIKEIDGQPRVNGTQGIFAKRLVYFCGGAFGRQMYYESIADPTELARQLMASHDLRWLGVPMRMRDMYLMSVEWFESSYDAAEGIIRIPTQGEKSIGFHAVVIEGYDPATQIFTFWNSWGSSWGDRGNGQMSLDYVQRYHLETLVTRPARWGPSPAKLNQMENACGNGKEIRRLWTVENPRFKYVFRGKHRNVVVIFYETMSPTLKIPVTCVELKNGFGLRMAWTFIRHWPDESKYSEITELFVWPLYRRMHFGSELEGQAVEVARAYGSTEIRLLMNEADSIVGPPRAAAREFAKSCGYELRWRTTVGPRARMTGIKSI
jgi:GNAT superfamily N-acetyltransferase